MKIQWMSSVSNFNKISDMVYEIHSESIYGAT